MQHQTQQQQYQPVFLVTNQGAQAPQGAPMVFQPQQQQPVQYVNAVAPPQFFIQTINPNDPTSTIPIQYAVPYNVGTNSPYIMQSMPSQVPVMTQPQQTVIQVPTTRSDVVEFHNLGKVSAFLGWYFGTLLAPLIVQIVAFCVPASLLGKLGAILSLGNISAALGLFGLSVVIISRGGLWWFVIVVLLIAISCYAAAARIWRSLIASIMATSQRPVSVSQDAIEGTKRDVTLAFLASFFFPVLGLIGVVLVAPKNIRAKWSAWNGFGTIFLVISAFGLSLPDLIAYVWIAPVSWIGATILSIAGIHYGLAVATLRMSSFPGAQL